MADSVRYALAVNGTVATVKIGAGLFTGSPAMLAEAAHSVVDCTTQAMLWVGDVRGAKRPAAPYRWGMGAAAVMFGSGGVYSLVTGVRELLEPGQHAGVGVWVSLVILVVASSLELSSMINAVRALAAGRNGIGWVRHLRTTTDTASKTVVVEDGADILGNTIAMVGIGAGLLFKVTWIDAVASIAVGLLLTVLALELVTHNRRELRKIGETA